MSFLEYRTANIRVGANLDKGKVRKMTKIETPHLEKLKVSYE